MIQALFFCCLAALLYKLSEGLPYGWVLQVAGILALGFAWSEDDRRD